MASPATTTAAAAAASAFPQALVAGRLLPLRAATVTASPDNPALTDQPPTRHHPTPGKTPLS